MGGAASVVVVSPKGAERWASPPDQGEIFLEQFQCTGDRNCCLDEERVFTHACWKSGNDAQVLPGGGAMAVYATCCKKKK